MATRDLDPLAAAERPPESFEATWRQAFRRRLLVIGVLVGVWTVGIQARLVFLQVIQHPAYLERAVDQQTRVYEPAAERGDLLDRNGEVLAYSVDAGTVSANPRAIKDPSAVVKAVCAVFADCTQKERLQLIDALSRKDRAFAYIRRGIAPSQAEQISALKLPGINVQPESRRYYPKRELASHVLGFVGRDNNGLGGVEQAYDSIVRGQNGRVLMLTDAKHNAVEGRVEVEPTAGASLELTIDQVLQHIAERELRAAVEKHRAEAGTLIALDPNTGEILALANYPDFNPNTPGDVSASLRRNRAVQEIYEPGSTFKIVTAAAAIEEGVIAPEDMIDTAPGVIRVPGRSKPVDDEHAYGLLSFADVIIKSSNVGAIKAGWQIGAERLNRYVRRFGFGEIHAPDFRGVSGGIVWPPERLDTSGLASVSMGYQVAVTPLQMVTATAAVANGGQLWEPRLVRATITDGRREEIAPKVLRRAISRETAAALTTIMEGVVTDGTAKTAAVPGYQVAGKTGTAQKIIDGRYSESDHVGSFTGFAPSRRPALAVVVVIDAPKAGGYYGGVVAAPVFQKFTQAALRHLGIPPTLNPTTPVLAQATPVVPARYTGRQSTTPRAVQVSGGLVMPDLTGMGARDASLLLAQFGMTIRLRGDGIVVSQSPAAGEPIAAGLVGTVQLDRPRPSRSDGGRQ